MRGRKAKRADDGTVSVRAFRCREETAIVLKMIAIRRKCRTGEVVASILDDYVAGLTLTPGTQTI